MPKPPKASYSYDVAKSCGGLRTFMQRNPSLIPKTGNPSRSPLSRCWGHGCCYWREKRNCVNTPSQQKTISQPQGCSANGRVKIHL